MSRSKRGQTIVVCPDVHVPYHDPLAWKTFLAAVKHKKPDVLVIIGDFADFYAVSFYSKKPDRARFLKAEIDSVNDELDAVQKLRVPRVVFLSGNHEARLERYLNEKAPELYGLIDVPTLFRFKERGWEYVPYGQAISIGKMDFSHDVGRCGKNAARASLEDYGDNITIGHTHQLGTAYVGTVRGSKRVCLNVGWLGGFKHVDYKHKNMALRSYQHGFGLIHQDSTGFSSCHAIPIHEGRCEVDGVWINGRVRS